MKKFAIVPIIYRIVIVLLIAVLGAYFPKAGGWQLPKDTAITPEIQEIFDEGYTKNYTAEGKVDLKPVMLTGTQIVSGTNYKFYCVDSENVGYTVVIYKNLKDECSTTSVKTTVENLSANWIVLVDTIKNLVNSEDFKSNVKVLVDNLPASAEALLR